MSSGGRFDFDDGGWYCGGWDQGKAHGRGVCTGPQTQGEYAGAWSHGFELLGVYSWPSGGSYKGTWAQGKRHGVGVETKACWEYRGEWTQGFKGRYGQLESTTSGARYEGTWSNGLQDGYGTETYSDGGTYQGQWLGGMRHGYGVRQSVPYGMAALILFPLRTSINSLRSDHSGPGPLAPEDGPVPPGDSSSGAVSGLSPVGRGGFALTAPSEAERRKRKGRLRQSILSGLKLRRSESKSSLASQLSKQSSYCSETGMSTVSSDLHSNHSQQGAPIDATVTEMYAGEWRTDQRTGFGIGRRSDGLHYAGEWVANKRHGYGCTTFPDGTKEEGKYKQNVLVSGKRKNLIPLRASKIREKVDRSVEAAEKASDISKQKAEIALSRMSHARSKAEAAEAVAQKALEESRLARITAKELSPSFHIYENGLESERPKHGDGKDKPDVSTGSESPLCTPDTTPSALTPDFSPAAPASPPKHRPRKTCFHRQSAMDDQAEIQVLVEGRGLELQRGGAHHTWDDRYSSRSTTPSLLEETEGQINGHEPVVAVANHKPRDKALSTNHKPRDINHYTTWEHSLSNQKPSKHGSTNHKTREYSSSNHKTWDHSSANHKPQLHVLTNHRGPDHVASNHKAAEHVSSNHHKPQDYALTNHNVKEHVIGYGNHKQHNHRPSTGHIHHWSPAHSRLTDEHSADYKDHYTVDMRLSDPLLPSPCPGRLRPRLRPVREASVDSVQRLDRLALGAEPDDRGAGLEGEGPEQWPMSRDLTLSTPLRSPPIIAMETEAEVCTKTSSGSSSFLVVMVILLNIGVAVLFIHFFI